MAEFTIDRAAIQRRQRRLVERLRQRGLTAALLTRLESINWLTGAYIGPLFPAMATIDLTGRTTLALPSRKKTFPLVADEVVTYEEKFLSTNRDTPDVIAAATTALRAAVNLSGPVGAELTSGSQLTLAAWSADWQDLDADLFQLRRRKETDELAIMRLANEANRAMYARAREIIRPGVNELDLYRELQSVSVQAVGEPLTYFGQDFQCAARGGPPRNRVALAGELYILDLGVGLRGYHTDNARTIAVSGEPTAAQKMAWDNIVPVFAMVEASIRPGVSCKAVFEEAQRMLAAAPVGVFNHHLGHGVGLAPHEGPHLNPNWDDTFEVGDYLAIEPGLYADELNHGIRLENNYVVTETGVELLTDWPLEL